jgi:hypothetical protein
MRELAGQFDRRDFAKYSQCTTGPGFAGDARAAAGVEMKVIPGVRRALSGSFGLNTDDCGQSR